MKTKHYREDDINLLLPTFRAKIAKLLQALRDAGHDPILRDTRRTPDEASKNADKGTGVALSMHVLGAAADLICNEHGWDCFAAKCQFFVALRDEAEKLGLTSGARWRRGGKGPDWPHVQAIRVNEQTRFRRIADDAAREAYLQRRDAKAA